LARQVAKLIPELEKLAATIADTDLHGQIIRLRDQNIDLDILLIRDPRRGGFIIQLETAFGDKFSEHVPESWGPRVDDDTVERLKDAVMAVKCRATQSETERRKAGDSPKAPRIPAKPPFSDVVEFPETSVFPRESSYAIGIDWAEGSRPDDVTFERAQPEATTLDQLRARFKDRGDDEPTPAQPNRNNSSMMVFPAGTRIEFLHNTGDPHELPQAIIIMDSGNDALPSPEIPTGWTFREASSSPPWPSSRMMPEALISIPPVFPSDLKDDVHMLHPRDKDVLDAARYAFLGLGGAMRRTADVARSVAYKKMFDVFRGYAKKEEDK
jgi:hypothetical protein